MSMDNYSQLQCLQRLIPWTMVFLIMFWIRTVTKQGNYIICLEHCLLPLLLPPALCAFHTGMSGVSNFGMGCDFQSTERDSPCWMERRTCFLIKSSMLSSSEVDWQTAKARDVKDKKEVERSTVRMASSMCLGCPSDQEFATKSSSWFSTSSVSAKTVIGGVTGAMFVGLETSWINHKLCTDNYFPQNTPPPTQCSVMCVKIW